MKKIILLTSVLFLSILAHAHVIYFKALLSGANEVPPNASMASGMAIVAYNEETNALQLYGNYQGLSNTISGSHIHLGAAGVNGSVMVTLTNTGGTTGTLSGSATLDASQETALLAGNTYVNVHSTGAFSGGEIRAQLSPTTENQTEFLKARLQGSQEVPPNPSTATGQAYLLLDKGTNMVYLTGSYSGLSAAISGSHIHEGASGATGNVIVSLVNSGGTSGTLHVETTVTNDQETLIASGSSYVNLHTPGTYASGEIRGQLTNLAQLTYLAGSLSGAEEVPANASTAKGTVIVRYNPENRLLELTGDYQSLSNTISGSHIHGPAAAGSNNSVVFTIINTGGSTGTLSLSQTLSETQEADLLNGLYYVNIHSTGTYAAGEIRAQLIPTAVGRTQYLTGFLQGSQEVPASGSAGTGTVTAILDMVTNKVFLTGTYTGLGGNATAAHIHEAPPGSTGGVLITLSVPGGTEGTVTGSGTLTAAQATTMLNGGTYVNIHSSTVGTGELRAQLGNLVLPVKLVSFTAFKERDKVSVLWTATQETNLLSYDVEQQNQDTKAWMKKGTVAAKGGSGDIQYRFSDVPSVSNGGSILYRLRINGIDGKVDYSHVVRVNYQTGKGELILLANPVKTGVLRFVVTGLPAIQKAEATVVDYNGRVVARAQVTSQMNNEINVSHLATGMYRLVVRVNNEVMQENFVK